MLNKLKRKFVLINMCLVGIVMLTVFSVYSINTYGQAKDEVAGALNMAIDDIGAGEHDFFEIGMPPDGEKREPLEHFEHGLEGKPMNYAAVVTHVTEKNGNRIVTLKGAENVFMSNDVMEDAVDAALSSEEEQGKLKNMALFYMKKKDAEGIKIAFADSSYFDSKIKKSLVTAAVLFSAGITALFLISLLLANVAVAPVKKAWEQQRRFVADASHELKTPLTVMLANNEILMETATENMMKWLESNREEANRMKDLVDALLFLARADEEAEIKDSVKVNKSLVDISDVIVGAALQMEPIMFEAGVSFENNVQKDINTVCDATQIKQLIHILLDNAAKYSAEGESIALNFEEKGNWLELKVTNTGAVIDERNMEHIFERFYREDKARSGGGYGLGLSIAKTITENHGGIIRAASDKNAGTTMTVQLPKQLKK